MRLSVIRRTIRDNWYWFRSSYNPKATNGGARYWNVPRRGPALTTPQLAKWLIGHKEQYKGFEPYRLADAIRNEARKQWGPIRTVDANDVESEPEPGPEPETFRNLYRISNGLLIEVTVALMDDEKPEIVVTPYNRGLNYQPISTQED